MPPTHVEPDGASPPSAPRWVKALGIIAVALILLLGVLHLTGISPGGPGSHTPPAAHGAQQR